VNTALRLEASPQRLRELARWAPEEEACVVLGAVKALDMTEGVNQLRKRAVEALHRGEDGALGRGRVMGAWWAVLKGAGVHAAQQGYHGYCDRVIPLLWATSCRNASLTRTLLEAGADVHPRINDGFRVLHLAAKVGDPQMFKMLVKAGANVLAQGHDGRTSLVGLGADVHAQMPDGCTALHVAAHRGCRDTVKALVDTLGFIRR